MISIFDISIVELRQIVLECRQNSLSDEDILKKLIAEKSSSFSIGEIERSIAATPALDHIKKTKIYDFGIYFICLGMIAYMILSPSENSFLDYLIFGSEILLVRLRPWGSLWPTIFIFIVGIVSTSLLNASILGLLLVLIIIRKKILYPRLNVLSGKQKTS